MLKIKCERCSYSNVYETEREAYLDGWYYRDGYGEGFPYRCQAFQICSRCQAKEIVEPVEIS